MNNRFKVGDKIRSKQWDKDDWFEIKFIDIQDRYYGIYASGKGDWWLMEGSSFELYTEPKTPITMYRLVYKSGSDTHISSRLYPNLDEIKKFPEYVGYTEETVYT